jgi:hypothetical protein
VIHLDPLLVFDDEFQQPRPAVGHLKLGGLLQLIDDGRYLLFGEKFARRSYLIVVSAGAREIHAKESPVPVDRGVPVMAAVEQGFIPVYVIHPLDALRWDNA